MSQLAESRKVQPPNLSAPPASAAWSQSKSWPAAASEPWGRRSATGGMSRPGAPTTSAASDVGAALLAEVSEQREADGELPSADDLKQDAKLADFARELFGRFGGEEVAGEVGLRKKVRTAGAEDERCPPAGARVVMHFAVRLANGQLVESSRERVDCEGESITAAQSRPARPPGPLSFVIGEGEVLRAYELLAATMVTGETCAAVATHGFAYGAGGAKHMGVPPRTCVVLELELVSWEVARREKDGLSDDERLAEAVSLKEGGTSAFKLAASATAKGDAERATRRLEQARRRYTDAQYFVLDAFEQRRAPHLGPGPPPPPPLRFGGEGGRLSEARELAGSCLLNEAMCCLKLERWREAAAACTKALDLELLAPAARAKALYRRGTAGVRLGEFEDARKDLRLANELDPKSREIREMFDECVLAEAEYRQTQKSYMSGKVLSGYEAPPDEPKEKQFVC